MKIKVIALSLCMMATSLTLVQGQNNKSDVTPTGNRHEIRLSVSDGLTIGTTGILGMGLADAITGSKRTDENYSLVYGLGYRYSLKRFRVGADLGFAHNSSQLTLNGESSPSLNEKELKFLILPTAEFTYFKRNLIELYGSAAAGVDLTRHTESPVVSHSRDNIKKTDLSTSFAYQINPIALRVGNDRIGGFLEAGLGYKGFLTAGISLRFYWPLLRAQSEYQKMRIIRKELFKTRFQTHYPRLCRIAYGYVANKEDAEDIVQELFINVWDKGKDDMPEEEFAAYMTTSVKNRSISFLRQKQENTVSLEDHPSVSAQIAEETHSPEREGLPLEEHLRIALTTLPPKCKEIFLMAKLKGMKYREIAQDLNLSEKTIENQMTKAIKLLRLYLAANRQALMALLITIILSILRIK